MTGSDRISYLGKMRIPYQAGFGYAFCYLIEVQFVLSGLKSRGKSNSYIMCRTVISMVRVSPMSTDY